MLRKERYDFILNHFRSALPNVTTELQFGSAFQLLVATLLSAQCTDKRINMVTPALFARYPDAQHMAKASEEDIYEQTNINNSSDHTGRQFVNDKIWTLNLGLRNYNTTLTAETFNSQNDFIFNLFEEEAK